MCRGFLVIAWHFCALAYVLTIRLAPAGWMNKGKGADVC